MTNDQVSVEKRAEREPGRAVSGVKERFVEWMKRKLYR